MGQLGMPFAERLVEKAANYAPIPHPTIAYNALCFANVSLPCIGRCRTLGRFGRVGEA